MPPHITSGWPENMLEDAGIYVRTKQGNYYIRINNIFDAQITQEFDYATVTYNLDGSNFIEGEGIFSIKISGKYGTIGQDLAFKEPTIEELKNLMEGE